MRESVLARVRGALHPCDAAMKAVGVFYPTREGQTERIAMHLAATLERLGIVASVCDVARHRYQYLTHYRAAVVAASVHVGRHEPEMVASVKQRAAQLETIPAAFLSISLSKAGAEDRMRAPRSISSSRPT